MQIPSTESSLADVTIPKNTSDLSLVTVNQRIRLRFNVLAMCKMKKYDQGVSTDYTDMNNNLLLYLLNS